MIKIKSLKKSFGEKLVLDSISVEFEQPGVYGIVGKNGAGKTTFFRILSKLEHQYSGDVDLGGSSLGYLPTELYFYPRMLGKEYLQFCLHAKKLSPRNYDRYNPIFNLPLDKEVSSYSSGMKKKLGIMGLILAENDILILDEPFNGLDIESSLLLSTIINKLAESGKTILLSSHILSTITDVAKEIFYLENGKFQNFSSSEENAIVDVLLDKEVVALLNDFEF